MQRRSYGLVAYWRPASYAVATTPSCLEKAHYSVVGYKTKTKYLLRGVSLRNGIGTMNASLCPRISRTDSVSRARDIVCVLAFVALVVGPVSLRAADVTWNNITGNFLWDTSDNNWSTGSWNNANGDGAIFGATGAGTINLTTPINVNSLNFTANGYTLGGAGLAHLCQRHQHARLWLHQRRPLASRPRSTLRSTARLGIIKLGAGMLELGGPMNFSGNGLVHRPSRCPPDRPHRWRRKRPNFNPILGGTIRILNTSVLPATARLGVSNGLFDLGANNITIAALNFVNHGEQHHCLQPSDRCRRRRRFRNRDAAGDG